ncbi:MAG: hypothetical protein V7629_13210 [Motiliproteus sp.]
MSKEKIVDVMGMLLSEAIEDDIPEVEQLNWLIYSGADDIIESELNIPQKEPVWKTENESHTVHVWNTKGKIRIKVLSKCTTKVSIKHLAEVALNAMMEDLKKGTP